MSSHNIVLCAKVILRKSKIRSAVTVVDKELQVQLWYLRLECDSVEQEYTEGSPFFALKMNVNYAAVIFSPCDLSRRWANLGLAVTANSSSSLCAGMWCWSHPSLRAWWICLSSLCNTVLSESSQMRTFPPPSTNEFKAFIYFFCKICDCETDVVVWDTLCDYELHMCDPPSPSPSSLCSRSRVRQHPNRHLRSLLGSLRSLRFQRFPFVLPSNFFSTFVFLSGRPLTSH